MNKWIYSITTLLILFISACAQSTDSDRFDYLITNATIIDGTGSESYNGHILIKDGVIVKTGIFEPSSILADAVIDAQGASAAYFVMNEDVMKRFLVDPFVMVSSDGSPSMRHPRGYGSFAKIIRQYVNEENLLTLEEAVHKMSGLTAETLGLSNSEQVAFTRGLIKEGFAADLLIFDPRNVVDRATFEEPHLFAGGFDWVFVNGVEVIRNGVKNNAFPGQVIRKK